MQIQPEPFAGAEVCECNHPRLAHQRAVVCQQVIHYPSEDYPCLCSGAHTADPCPECEHPAKMHHVVKRCTADPANCSCVIITAA